MSASSEAVDTASSATGEMNGLADLLERVSDLRLFDRTLEVNTYCDDLVSQVLLSVQSAVAHLFKIQDELTEEVEKYRTGLLTGEKASEPSPDKVKMIEMLKHELEKLSEEIKNGHFNRPATPLVAGPSDSGRQELLESHKDRVIEICNTTLDWFRKALRDLKWRMRKWAFNESFLRYRAKNFASQDKNLVGELYISDKETESPAGKQLLSRYD